MTVEVLPVDGIGEIHKGDDLGEIIADAAGPQLLEGDIVVVSSKILAKSLGLSVALLPEESIPEARRRVALQYEVVTDTPGVLIVRHAKGWVMANAGIDQSNTGHAELLELPPEPDEAAAELVAGINEALGIDVGIIIADTFGRAWRLGQTEVAIGAANLVTLADYRGWVDRDGDTLDVTEIAVADQIAGAADLVRDKSSGVPVVIVRGLSHLVGNPGTGAMLVRPRDEDLFAHGRGWLARRLASGEGAALRPGPPTASEWVTVVTAAGRPNPSVGRVDQNRYITDDGLAAGRAEACLLDLGYHVAVTRSGATYRVAAF